MMLVGGRACQLDRVADVDGTRLDVPRCVIACGRGVHVGARRGSGHHVPFGHHACQPPMVANCQHTHAMLAHLPRHLTQGIIDVAGVHLGPEPANTVQLSNSVSPFQLA
jgi:hypothetical protein